MPGSTPLEHPMKQGILVEWRETRDKSPHYFWSFMPQKCADLPELQACFAWSSCRWRFCRSSPDAHHMFCIRSGLQSPTSSLVGDEIRAQDASGKDVKSMRSKNRVDEEVGTKVKKRRTRAGRLRRTAFGSRSMSLQTCVFYTRNEQC